MNSNILKYLAMAAVAAGLTACSNDGDLNTGRYEMTFCFGHPSTARVTETAFEKGDAVGLFVTEHGTPLEIGGNFLTNEKMVFDGTNWASSRKLYWDAGFFNVYSYYPYAENIPSITDYAFEVSADQRANPGAEGIDGYEASDFLYASYLKYAASSTPVNMMFRHLMSKLTIRLVKGEDYEGDLPENALVEIHNTVPKATIDLEAGVATKDAYATVKTIKARQESASTYTAIIVPQRMPNRVPLIEISTSGVSYLFESKFTFKPGTHHIVNLVIDDNPEKVKIEIGGEITGW